MSNYRYCAVPQCKSTSIKTPNKLFISVPTAPKIRLKWLQLARRDPGSLKSAFKFCEDHFDLPNDMENYTQYVIMGSVAKVKLKDGCLPSKFACQVDRQKRTSDVITDRTVLVKKQRILNSKECQHMIEQHDIPVADDAVQDVALNEPSDIAIVTRDTLLPIVEQRENPGPSKRRKEVYFRSAGVQCSANTKCSGTSPQKVCNEDRGVMTSPMKQGQKVVVESSEDDQKNEGDDTNSSFSDFTPSAKEDSDDSFHDESFEKSVFANQSRSVTIKTVMRKPQFYLGIPEKCLFIISLLSENTQIDDDYILLCLKKIRMDTTFSELGDNFGISLSYASKIFLHGVPKLANALLPFLIRPSKETTIKNLPIAFRHRYYEVDFLIDCFEIMIQTPSDPVNQALTWSAYKKGNTIKYLVASTPDGIISFVSPGYGGRTSDLLVVTESKFLDFLKPGDCLLADRGFKHLETLLIQRGIKLVRPPSVPSGSKLTKLEVRQTRSIACLRIHIERVIRRIREFSMLSKYACTNCNLVRVLDECVVIACALINLQNALIR